MIMSSVNFGTARHIDHIGRVRERCSYVTILQCFGLTALIFWIDGSSAFPRFLATATNSTRSMNTTNNATTGTKSSNATMRVPQNDSFCVLPNDTFWSTPYYSCKMESETWKSLLSTNVSSNQNRDVRAPNVTSEEVIDDDWTGECGPQCRPSCITLLLDLDRLTFDSFLCPNGASCGRPCEHVSQSTCRSSDADALYQRYPKCFLEEAQCYGPTMYEDIAAMYESRFAMVNSNNSLPALDHCTAIPRQDFYQRFQGWNVVSPIKRQQESCSNLTTKTNCFNESSKIYFEYCNVVEEDYSSCRSCQATDGAACLENNQCPKIIQPFPDGWTTFVVSASIPFPDKDVSCRLDSSTNIAGVDSVCFLQQIQLYFPPSCPRCHACPQISLGDTFGPLEVVGFGHAIQQSCAPCHRPSLVTNLSAHAFSCEAIERCHESVDCHSGTSLGLPSFLDNQCSFQADVDEDFTDDVLTPLPEMDFPTLSPTTDSPVMMTMLPSLARDNDDDIADQNNTLADNQTALPDDETPPDIEDSPAPSSNHRLSPLVVSLIVTGLVIVVGVQLALYRKMMSAQRDPPRRIAEEIVYIEPLEFDGLDKMLASDAGSDHTAADEDPTVDSDADNPSSWSPPWRSVSPPEKLQQEIRHFQTASILERSDQNEVEALYMTGQHHIQLTS